MPATLDRPPTPAAERPGERTPSPHDFVGTAEPPRLMFDRILVPLDGTPQATVALSVACTLAQAYGSQIVLLRVVDTTAKRYDANSELERIAADFASNTVSITRDVWISSDVASQIVRAAAEKCADLVVMATHGDRASRRAVMGSVTEAVVAQSPVPVLVIPVAPPQSPLTGGAVR